MMGNPNENSLFELMNKRKEIENEMKSFEQVLKDNGVGLNDSLVDSEQYPRSDIDIYSVRLARKRIHELNTDYNEIMKKIEGGLADYYASAKNAEPDSAAGNRPSSVSSSRNGQVSVAVPSAASHAPMVAPIGLARVDQVFENSPAYHSGIRVGDIILSVGSIDSLVARGNLTPIAAEIQANVNNTIPVRVRRSDGETLLLQLTPRSWPGQGYLGCHILPLQ